MLAVSSVDADGAPWASLIFGEVGFARTADGTSVTIDRARIIADGSDPLWSNLRVGAPLGLLAIDLGSRRRLRINGIVSALSDAAIELAVREAYPNCPKYIQRRLLHVTTRQRAVEGASEGKELDSVRRATIEAADTMFVASTHPEGGADVSHRGGPPGFVCVLDQRTLRVPDYRGNSLYNTLGNIAVTKRAGILVPDFERGRALQLVGDVALRFDLSDDPGQPTGGTGRYWELHLSRWFDRPLPGILRWTLLDASPYNPSRRAGQDASRDATSRDGRGGPTCPPR
jgi:predicted pyridoxine 5'-phosphate oxidase superfamily flavin-nucleotide-binding protein